MILRWYYNLSLSFVYTSFNCKVSLLVITSFFLYLSFSLFSSFSVYLFWHPFNNFITNSFRLFSFLFFLPPSFHSSHLKYFDAAVAREKWNNKNRGQWLEKKNEPLHLLLCFGGSSSKLSWITRKWKLWGGIERASRGKKKSFTIYRFLFSIFLKNQQTGMGKVRNQLSDFVAVI